MWYVQTSMWYHVTASRVDYRPYTNPPVPRLRSPCRPWLSSIPISVIAKALKREPTAVRCLSSSRRLRHILHRCCHPTPTLEGGQKPITGGERTHLLLAFVVYRWPRIPFETEHTVPTPNATPAMFCGSLRFFRVLLLHQSCLLILSPSCLAVSGHPLSPRVAIVFPLLSSPPNASMSHNFVWSLHPPSLAHPISPCRVYILLLCES